MPLLSNSSISVHIRVLNPVSHANDVTCTTQTTTHEGKGQADGIAALRWAWTALLLLLPHVRA
jgi:hypothetical protein